MSELIDDVRRYLGAAPFHEGVNLVKGDEFFRQSLDKKHGKVAVDAAIFTIQPDALRVTKPPPAPSSCETCAHWYEKRDEPIHGECRRYPPSSTLTVGNLAGGRMGEVRITIFPVTAADVCCGEHRPRQP